MFEKVKSNKILKFTWNLIYTFVFMVVLLLLIIVFLQRVTNNNITIAGIRIFSVVSGSMVPVYDVGDVVLAKEVDINEINVDDDVVYEGSVGSFENKIVTHRVISKQKKENGNYEIITKGIVNSLADPAIDHTQILGKVLCEVHILSLFSKLLQNAYKLYIFIFIPIAILLFRQIKIIKEIKAEIEEDGENKKVSCIMMNTRKKEKNECISKIINSNGRTKS